MEHELDDTGEIGVGSIAELDNLGRVGHGGLQQPQQANAKLKHDRALAVALLAARVCAAFGLLDLLHALIKLRHRPVELVEEAVQERRGQFRLAQAHPPELNKGEMWGNKDSMW